MFASSNLPPLDHSNATASDLIRICVLFLADFSLILSRTTNSPPSRYFPCYHLPTPPPFPYFPQSCTRGRSYDAQHLNVKKRSHLSFWANIIIQIIFLKQIQPEVYSRQTTEAFPSTYLFFAGFYLSRQKAKEGKNSKNDEIEVSKFQNCCIQNYVERK